MRSVWYAAYGSNLSRSRFLHDLLGGRAPGALRALPGARDRRLPTGDRPVVTTGGLRFGWISSTWGGGVALYDGAAAGHVLARAYRITAGQFSDVAAQEMHTEPGGDLDLAPVLRHGQHAYGPGRYEAVHHIVTIEGEPILTFAPTRLADLPPNAPSTRYLATMTSGLAHAHHLDADACADYFLSAEGIGPWTRDRLREAARAALGSRADPQ